jgi:hypothetical protein
MRMKGDENEKRMKREGIPIEEERMLSIHSIQRKDLFTDIKCK